MASAARGQPESQDTSIVILGGQFSISQHIDNHLYCPGQDHSIGSTCGQRPQDERAPESRQSHSSDGASPSGRKTLSSANQLFSAEQIAFSALHSSAQRYPPPKCLPGTRDAVLSLLTEWITKPRQDQSILWLYGTAGVGKSAIMQTLCDTFLTEGGCIPAAFFFGRGQGEREKGELLASTLSFQLVRNLPGYKKCLEKMRLKTTHLHTQSLPQQCATLLADAFKASRRWPWRRGPFSSPLTIIVDGLDECKGEENQAAIIESLHQVSRNTNHALRFLIASRPESHILVAFNNQDTARSTKRVPLDDTFRPAEAIRFYFRTKFRAVVECNQGKLPKSGWPGDTTIEILVQAAWGQFIFAHLVIAFVSMPRRDPQKQLQIDLDARRNAIAFSPLDLLYVQILDNIPSEQRTVLAAVLACVVVLREPQPIATITNLMSLDEATAVVVLDQLRAVLASTPDIPSLFTQPVRFAHASFRDFLVNRVRSGIYFVDQPAAHSYIVQRYYEHCVRQAKSPLRQGSPSLPSATNHQSYSYDALSPASSDYLTRDVVCFHMAGCGKEDEEPVLGAMRLHLRRAVKQVPDSVEKATPPCAWDEVIEVFATAALQEGGFSFLDHVAALIQDCLSGPDPSKQLAKLFDADRYQRPRPSGPLSVLYSDLLDNIPTEHQHTTNLILGCILVAREPLSITAICSLTVQDVASVQFILSQLRSVVSNPRDTSPSLPDGLRFTHPSFRHYLSHSPLPGQRYINQPAIHRLLVRRYHQHRIHCYITTRPFSNHTLIRPLEPHSDLSPDAAAYLRGQNIRFHISASGESDEDPTAGAIRSYLRDGFKSIGAEVPGYEFWWHDMVNTFISTASRQGELDFCLADLVLAYLQRRMANCDQPRTRMNVILDIKRHLTTEMPFDAFYSHILDDVLPGLQQNSNRVLNCIALVEPLSIAAIADIASVDDFDTELALAQLPFIIHHSHCSEPKAHLALGSFRDFILDPIRSGSHALVLPAAHRHLFLRWLTVRFGTSAQHGLREQAARYLDEHFAFHGEAYDGGEMCQDLARYIPEDFDWTKFMDEMGHLTWLDGQDKVLAGLQTLLGAHTRKHGSTCPHVALLTNISHLQTDLTETRRKLARLDARSYVRFG